MKIELIKHDFDGYSSYKYIPFEYCCEELKNNPLINLSDEYFANETDHDDDGEMIPAFALCHSEIFQDWGDEWQNDTYYKIRCCPFCGEPIEIYVIGKKDCTNLYNGLKSQREKVWKWHNETDSKRESEELRKLVNELDDKINWFHELNQIDEDIL